jgi:hypothetical protein
MPMAWLRRARETAMKFIVSMPVALSVLPGIAVCANAFDVESNGAQFCQTTGAAQSHRRHCFRPAIGTTVFPT